MKKILLLMLCWFLIGTVDVYADSVKVKGIADGALQEGDLLVGEGFIAPKMSSALNVNGAKAAMKTAATKLKDTVDISAYGITVSQLSKVYGEFLNENPRFFYLSGAYRYLYNNAGYVTKLYFTYEEKKADIPAMLLEYDHEVNKILSQVDSRWTTFEKILFVNEYIAQNCVYNEAALTNSSIDAYDAYKVFVKKLAVCQGYALAVEELMDRMGIPCELVTSKSVNHAWNMVYLNGKWYHMDVTWDDPVTDRVGRVGHRHLLKSTQDFYTTHKNTKTGVLVKDYVYTGNLSDYSAYYSTTYDNCFWDDIYTPFSYLNGYWYNIVRGSDNKGYLNSYRIDGVYMIYTGTVMNVNEKWTVWNDSNRYWYYYGECVSYNGALFYSTPTKLMVIYPNGSVATLYQLSQAEKYQGYIYGFSINPYGEVEIGLAISPAASMTVARKYFHTHTAGAAATCISHQTCTTCGKIMVRANGHAPGKQKTAAATFVKAKTTYTYCSRCNALVSETASGKKLSCRKGAVYTVGNYKYKIISNKTNGNGTVAFHGLARNVKKVAIGNTVTIKGASFKITNISSRALWKKTKVTAFSIGSNLKTIGKEAFYGAKKLKSITIKSTKLTSVGKNAIRNIHKKATIYVPNSCIKKYRKLFR